MDFNWIHKPVEIKEWKQIDTRYFIEQEENVYKLTPSFFKVIAKDAQEYFKQKVLQFDTDGTYTGKPKSYTVEDTDATRKAKEKYRKQYEQFEDKWEKYKNSHEEEFEAVIVVDPSYTNIAHSYLYGFLPDIPISSALDALRAYKAAKELEKKYGKGGDEYDNLPTCTKIEAKPEFKDTHTALKEKWRKELGLPEETEIKVTYQEERPTLISANSNVYKSVEPDDEHLEEYAKEAVNYMVNA